MKRRLIEHVAYIVALIFFAIVGLTFLPIQIKEYYAIRQDVQKVQTMNNSLRARLQAMNEYPPQDLENTVVVLNTLYPSDEDRFSIFASLDNLEKVTGIDILSYSSPFSGKAFQDVSIVVKAKADLAHFRTFLADHSFRSGRFMTISKILYSQEKQSLNFTASFYSKNIKLQTSKAVEIRPELLEQAAQIKKEIESAGIIKRENPSPEATPVDYSTKPNPFN